MTTGKGPRTMVCGSAGLQPDGDCANVVPACVHVCVTGVTHPRLVSFPSRGGRVVCLAVRMAWFAGLSGWQTGWHGLRGSQDGMVTWQTGWHGLHGSQNGMVCMTVRMAWFTWHTEWHGLHGCQDGMVYMADRLAWFTWQTRWHGLHGSRNGMVYMADRKA